MASVTVQVRMDEVLKEKVEHNLKKMGLNMSTAINLFCTQVVNQGRIPFEIVLPEEPNEETRKAMEDTLAGRNLSRKFNNTDEMWADLNA